MERPAQTATRAAGYSLCDALLIEIHVVLGQGFETRRHVGWSMAWVAAGHYAIPDLSSLRAKRSNPESAPRILDRFGRARLAMTPTSDYSSTNSSRR
jgi:hypothetical protein